jgi:hypothetical protein
MKHKRVYLRFFHRELVYTPLDLIYEHQVLQCRPRRVELWGKVCQARVQKTLLGYELKMGVLRKNCPDLGTANYLRVFASLGLPAVSIPYNPVETARLAPLLDRSFQEINQKIEQLAPADTEPDRHLYFRCRIYHYLATRIREMEDR